MVVGVVKNILLIIYIRSKVKKVEIGGLGRGRRPRQ